MSHDPLYAPDTDHVRGCPHRFGKTALNECQCAQMRALEAQAEAYPSREITVRQALGRMIAATESVLASFGCEREELIDGDLRAAKEAAEKALKPVRGNMRVGRGIRVPWESTRSPEDQERFISGECRS